MTAILERRESASLWARFCEWITSTENRMSTLNYSYIIFTFVLFNK